MPLWVYRVFVAIGCGRARKIEERIVFSRCEIAFVPDAAKAVYRSRVLEALDLSE